MITEREKEEKHLDKIIAFNLKEMKKMRKAGRMKDWVKHSNTLDLMYELKRAMAF